MNVTTSSASPGSQSPATASLPAAGGNASPVSQPAAAATQQPASTAAPSPQPSSEQVKNAIENMKRVIAPVAQDLQFSVDSETNRTVVTVVDTSTKEVIRQIPSEEFLALAKGLDKLQGLLFKKQA